jgi:SAM-dependent methyltransferase
MAAFHQRHELPGSVRFEVIDVSTIPYREAFDIVCMKSVLGGIGREGHLDVQRAALDSIVSALKPGGVLLFVENLVSTRVHMVARRRCGAAKNQWRYFEPAELHDLVAAAGLRVLNMGSTGFLGTFGRSEFQKRTLGRCDGLLCPLLPRSWHYIGYGVARKPADTARVPET